MSITLAARADRARPPRAAVLAAYAAVYVLWGSTYLAIRIGVATLPPFGMVGVRNVVAGTILYSWARLRGAPAPTRRQWGATAVIGALLLLGGNGSVTWAEQRVPSGIAALLVATEPLWVVLLGWWRPGGRRPGIWTGAGVVLGLLGVAMLLGPTISAHGARVGGAVDVIGAAVLVTGALSWAAGSLWSNYASSRSQLPASAPLATGMQMLVGGALLLGMSVAAGEPAAFRPVSATRASLAALGYLIVFGSLLGFNAYAWLLGVEPPARVATYAFVNPVIAVLLGWGLAGESLTPRTLVAAAVIVGAVVVLTRRATRDGPEGDAGAAPARKGSAAQHSALVSYAADVAHRGARAPPRRATTRPAHPRDRSPSSWFRCSERARRTPRAPRPSARHARPPAPRVTARRSRPWATTCARHAARRARARAQATRWWSRPCGPHALSFLGRFCEPHRCVSNR